MARKAAPSLMVLIFGIALGALGYGLVQHQPAEAAAVDHTEQFIMMSSRVSTDTEVLYILNKQSHLLTVLGVDTTGRSMVELGERPLAQDFTISPKMLPRWTMASIEYQNGRAALMIGNTRMGELVSYIFDMSRRQLVKGDSKKLKVQQIRVRR